MASLEGQLESGQFLQKALGGTEGASGTLASMGFGRLGTSEEDKERMDNLRAQNEKLAKKLGKMAKRMQQMGEASKAQINAMEREIAKKAEKQSIVESQQNFIDNMTKIESQTGDSLSKLVEEELKKISD